ncbi:sensor histidine kinase [Aquicoccus sp. SCR17]|nr:sensor histidine kinase [Carideicomes alvinocaridis]
MITRAVLIAGFVALTFASSAAVWRYGYDQALDQVARRAEADLALASDRLTAQLKRYRELAVLLADHPHLAALTEGGVTQEERARARRLLVGAADKTSALDLFYVSTGGTVLAAAHGPAPPDLGKAAYFRRALDGALGNAHGVYDQTGRRAFVYAAPAFGPGGAVRAVMVAVADVEWVEWEWRGGWPTVYFVDEGGEVFISNRSELLFWQRPEGSRRLVPPGEARPDFRRSEVSGHEIWRLDWGPYVPPAALHLARDLPVIGMVSETLVDVAPARRLALWQAMVTGAVLLSFGALLFLATERRRTLARANAVLEARVATRTAALSASNEQLRREVSEREEAEAALKQAQAELVQAGKLSALGRMSAGISHELNQPLMAIQQFAGNGARFLERDRPEQAAENLSRIAGLADRMARIIRNLRAFARNEAEPVARVDMVQVIESALEMTEARRRAEGIALDWTPPVHPVHVLGGEVRLGQVLVNLITNAADAMARSDPKILTLRLTEGARVAVSVADTGPGIEQPEKLFEPFYTTKEVGGAEGMGLGLSISYGLVQSFGGAIRGENTGAGAIFTLELDRYEVREAAE